MEDSHQQSFTFKRKIPILRSKNHTVTKDILNCVTCRRVSAKSLTQIMGNSPLSRVNPCRVFKRVGMAFDRPITSKCAHKRKSTNSKLHMYLFICMCIKALHIAFVLNLSTDPHGLGALTTAHVLNGEPLIQLLH